VATGIDKESSTIR